MPLRRNKPKFDPDPSVRFPRRRETDLQAEIRVEQLDLRAFERENSGPTFNREMARKLGFRLKQFGQSREMTIPSAR